MAGSCKPCTGDEHWTLVVQKLGCLIIASHLLSALSVFTLAGVRVTLQRSQVALSTHSAGQPGRSPFVMPPICICCFLPGPGASLLLADSAVDASPSAAGDLLTPSPSFAVCLHPTCTYIPQKHMKQPHLLSSRGRESVAEEERGRRQRRLARAVQKLAELQTALAARPDDEGLLVSGSCTPWQCGTCNDAVLSPTPG